MLMSPEKKLLQDEKGKDAGQNQTRSLGRAAQSFKGLGQQMDEGVTEQTAHGKTDHEKYNAP